MHWDNGDKIHLKLTYNARCGFSAVSGGEQPISLNFWCVSEGPYPKWYPQI